MSDRQDEWYKVRYRFPLYIDKKHPLYDALEVYHEDTQEVIGAGMLIECDLVTGYVRYKAGEQGTGARRQDIIRSTRGPWRCRWREDKVVKVEDKPPVTHYGMMGYTGP